MGGDSDITITCRECGGQFVFTIDQQAYYQEKGYTAPHHCPRCRSTRRNQYLPICTNCGSEIPKGEAAYCRVCLGAATLDLGLDVKRLELALNDAAACASSAQTEKAQACQAFDEKLRALELQMATLAKEAESKVSAAETEAARLAGLLREEKQVTAGLQEKCRNTTLELEKALKYRATLDGVEPALNEIRNRLQALELAQTNLDQTTSELGRRFEKASEHVSLTQAVVRLLRPRRPHSAAYQQ